MSSSLHDPRAGGDPAPRADRPHQLRRCHGPRGRHRCSRADGRADRDVSEVRAELRAHTQALNALRETQLEQGREIREQGREMRDGFATVAVGVAQITALLTVAGGRPAGNVPT
ncbi:MAG: hypothetical protein M3332_10230 [Actinomycetota bacterium]|nr:hypothetical protein [Actinomycetota bacterium]